MRGKVAVALLVAVAAWGQVQPGSVASQPFSQSPAATRGTVAAKLQQTVSVTDSPNAATCDGTTDDASAFTAHLSALGSGGVLLVPDGKSCAIASGITLPSGITLRLGDGSSIPCSASATCIVGGTGTVLEGQSQATSSVTVSTDQQGATIGTNGIIRNITIVGSCTLSGNKCAAGTAAASQGIASGGVDGWLVDRVTVRGFKNHGINFGGSSTNATVSNSIFTGNRNDGIFIAAGSDYAKIMNNQSIYNGSNGIDTNASFGLISGNTIHDIGGNLSGGGIDDWAILIDSLNGTNANADGNIITNNRAYAIPGHGIVIRAEQTSYHASNNLISSNTVDGGSAANGTYGIFLDVSVGVGCGTTANTVIISNTVKNYPTSGAGIAIGGGGSPCTVSGTGVLGNTLTGNASWGAILNYGSGAIVSGNIATGNGTDLYLIGSTTTQLGINQYSSIAVGTATTTLGSLSGTGSRIVQSDASGNLAGPTVTTVGSLGTCNAGAIDTIKIVTDALAPVSYATVAAGGARRANVQCDGTNWVVH